jgi:hypothetical protein
MAGARRCYALLGSNTGLPSGAVHRFQYQGEGQHEG